MYFLSTLLVLVFYDKTFAYPPSDSYYPFYYPNYNPYGKKRPSAAVTSISSVGNNGATVVSLDGELAAKMQKAVGGYSQRMMQKSFADGDNLSKKIQADVDESIKNSFSGGSGLFGNIGLGNMAGFGGSSGFGGGFGDFGLGNVASAGFGTSSGFGDFGTSNMFGDIDKSISDMSKSIQESQAQSQQFQNDMQEITNQALRKAAKEGKLNVISSSAASGGPVAISQSTNINGQGSGFVYTGGAPGGSMQIFNSASSEDGSPNMQIFSNVGGQVQVSGGGYSQQNEESQPQEDQSQRTTYGQQQQRQGQQQQRQRKRPRNPPRRKFANSGRRAPPRARGRAPQQNLFGPMSAAFGKNVLEADD